MPSPSTIGRRRSRRCRRKKSWTAVSRSGTPGKESRVAAATPERRSIWRVGSESTWTTVVPVVFIIASLLSLVILPIVFSAHTARMRNEITRVAEPARRAANEIQMDLSAEVDRLMAFQDTGQKQYRDEYLRRIEDQRRDYDRLRALGAQLAGAEPRPPAAEAGTVAARRCRPRARFAGVWAGSRVRYGAHP